MPEVRVEFVTTYMRLARFSGDFVDLAEGRRTVAALDEELFA